MVFSEKINLENCFEGVKSLLIKGKLTPDFQLSSENLEMICSEIGVGCTSTNYAKVKKRIFGSKVSTKTDKRLQQLFYMNDFLSRNFKN